MGLRWTKEPLTLEGWYFVKMRDGDVFVRRFFRTADDEMVCWLCASQQSVVFLMKIGAMFAGPIEEPEE